MNVKCVVLDVMGVIYEVCDDVVDLLHPFIVEKGGINDLAKISETYLEASLGKMASADFWKAVGVNPGLEDEYLSRHILSKGLLYFLEAMRLRGMELWCLSNDVSEWSRKLRHNYGVEGYFRGFIISGDVRLRKPDPAIYKLLTGRLKCKANEILFVDDNARNIDAASGQGIATVLFDPSGQAFSVKHKMVRSFAELGTLIA